MSPEHAPVKICIVPYFRHPAESSRSGIVGSRSEYLRDGARSAIVYTLRPGAAEPERFFTESLTYASLRRELSTIVDRELGAPLQLGYTRLRTEKSVEPGRWLCENWLDLPVSQSEIEGFGTRGHAIPNPMHRGHFRPFQAPFRGLHCMTGWTPPWFVPPTPIQLLTGIDLDRYALPETLDSDGDRLPESPMK